MKRAEVHIRHDDNVALHGDGYFHGPGFFGPTSGTGLIATPDARRAGARRSTTGTSRLRGEIR